MCLCNNTTATISYKCASAATMLLRYYTMYVLLHYAISAMYRAASHDGHAYAVLIISYNTVHACVMSLANFNCLVVL